MKQSFGRGLESLIPKKINNQAEKEVKKEPIFYIEVEKIRSNPYQPRKTFNQDGLKTLADSIKEYGILQPLLVSRIEKDSGTEYQLVAGERRFLAAKIIGLTQVPVIVRDPTEKEKLEVSLIENVQRVNLNPMEKAEAYKRLQDEFNFTHKDIAHMVGRSRESIANTIRLIDLTQDVKQALRDEKISEGHARAILAVDTAEKQKDLLFKTVRDGLSVRDTESLTQKMNIWQPIKKKASLATREMRALEDKIKKALGFKNVKIRIEGGRPKLSILFNSKEEINDLLKKIG
ncbi:MAG: ParB/RepB/Spo0J family partition protein [Candidatus Omnitrophota bacterium]